MEKQKIQLPEQLGAIPDIPDRRDFLYEDIMGGRPVGMPSFEKGYDAEEAIGQLKDDHQDNSLRCVSQGGTNDVELSILATTQRHISLSIRDGYSQIYAPNGGASPRDFYKLAKNKGICEESFCPSYPADGSKVSETWTRKRGDITPERIENALQWRIGAYRSIYSLDLEVMAQAIFENNGCGGAYKPLNSRMGHMIFFKGYGIHKGYYGLKYRDSYSPYQKWIIKHKGRFYYASTTNPLAFQIQLFSIWTAEAGNWIKKKMEKIPLKRAVNTKKVYGIKDGEKHWLVSWKDVERWAGYNSLEEAQKAVQEVEAGHLDAYPYGGNIGDPSFFDFIFGRK